MFSGLATTANLGWFASGTVKVWAANMNAAGAWSTPVSASIAILVPAQPLVVGEVWRNQVTLSWQDCKASQPLAHYQTRVGATFATSVEIAQVSGTTYEHSQEVPGSYIYWVVPFDVAGNAGANGYVAVNVLPGIDEAISQLTTGLDAAVADMALDVSLLRTKDAFDAAVSSVNISSEAFGRAIAITEEVVARTTAVSAEAASRATAIAAEATTR